MERDEQPLLHEPDLMLAVLRVAAGPSGTLEACIDQLRTLRACAGVERLVPEDEVRSQLEAVAAKLGRASLIERAAANGVRITARGRQVLAEHPDGVDETVLLQLKGGCAVAGRRDEAHEVRPPVHPEYEAGYEAYGAGYGLVDNPHPADARAHLDWQNGWSQARDDTLRRRR